MFGGAVIGEWAAPRRGVKHDMAPGWSTTTLALAASVLVASLAAVFLAGGHRLALEPQTSADIRRTLVVAAGALFFGAGLIQLSVWQVDRSASRGQGGVALIVFGFSAAFLSGQGPLIHTSPQTAMLNPVAAAVVALSTLGVICSTRRASPRNVLRPGLLVTCWLAATAVAFTAIVLLRQVGHVDLDPAPTFQLALELTIATAWLSAAIAAVRGGEAQAEGAGADTGLLSAFAFVWLMRALAVYQPVAWGLASALLLALVSVVALVRAMTELSEAAKIEHDRIDAAETALAAATDALQAYDDRGRDIRHGSRNSMLALRLATRTLAEHGERLDPETRVQLSRAIVGEVALLEGLLAHGHCSSTAGVGVRIPAQAVRS